MDQLELLPPETPLGDMVTGQHELARMSDIVPITRALIMILERGMITGLSFARLGQALLADDATLLRKHPDTMQELTDLGIIQPDGTVTIRAAKWNWKELRAREGWKR